MPFKIVRNDITKMHADAIVNTANPDPVVGGGTDSAIYSSAGEKRLLEERRKIGRIDRGQAAVTPAFDLNAKYIIHTVGPVWKGGTWGEEKLLRSCYENSLKLAKEYGCESIAFPLISTGVYGFPKDLALQIVVSVVSRFLTENDMMIYLVVFDKKAVRLSERLFEIIESQIDDSYVQIRHQEEHGRDLEGRDTARSGMAGPEMSGRGMARTNMAGPEMSGRDMSEPEVARTNMAEPCANRPVRDGFFGSSIGTVRKRLSDLMKQKQETFQQMLLRLIREKGMTNAEAYTRANQDKKLFSKIKNNPDYQPKKKTALAFALALELSMDETKDLLARAGYALSPSSDFDRVISYCIETKEYNIYEIEIILYDLGLDTLCNY